MKLGKAPTLTATKMPETTGEMVQGEITYNYRGLAGQKDLGKDMINKAMNATNDKAC
jgi:hypothetical protein